MNWIMGLFVALVLVIVGAFIRKFAPVGARESEMISWVIYAIVFLLLLAVLLAVFGIDNPVVQARA
jgi:hypothetical protein